ncbi:ribosomal protein S27E [Pseudomonas sp. JAI120]|nr:ribosomal protein S27E [Pseudomonas sp. SJZ073]MBB6311197.1 ribosomal protein S27E [Pseudomonas sp. JAI120]
MVPRSIAGPLSTCQLRSKCGRGLAPDSGGSASTSINCAAAIEASLKLDISHRGPAVLPRSIAWSLSTCQLRSKCGRELAPDSGGAASTSINCATAIEASLKLDISHRGPAVFSRYIAGSLSTCQLRSKCGRGLAPDSGGSASTSINCATAIEASLKLDISHRGPAVLSRSIAGSLSTCQPRSNVGGAVRRFDLLPIAVGQPAPLSTVPPPSKPR